MRTLFAVASITLLVGTGVGCGDDTTAPAVMDMAVGVDMTIPHDMATLTCAQTITCIQACAGSQSCDLNCISLASSSAQQLFEAFEGCLFETCSTGDGGNGSCTSVTDTSTTCTNCLNSTGQGAALGGPCAAEFSSCTSH